MYMFKLTVPFALVHYSFLKNTKGPLAFIKIILYTIHELKFLNCSTQQLVLTSALSFNLD
jgi:hypothetical protein